MVKDILSRDLGLLSTVLIGIGAMVGPGIFILPGIAAGLAGPAVVLSFIIAGLVALTAALSISELATAMPVSGGAYIYSSRSMGPLVGSITGWGIWISFILKCAFALVGLNAYLVIVVAIPASTQVVSVIFCAMLLFLNVFGTKASGRFQAIVVSMVLSALMIFVVIGAPRLSFSNLEPFAPFGAFGVIAAAGLVFVSFVGMLKIASIAEEIREPARNIPRGIIISTVVTLVIYGLVVFVTVCILPFNALAGSYTPISDAIGLAAGGTAASAIAVIAVIAMISTANAAILATTRYPFALSRDQLMPKWLLKVNSRFSTPVNSIVLTGCVIIVLIIFLDVVSIAKLASAFLILMMLLMHVALLMFRYAKPPEYRPAFRSPLFPYVQVVGIGTSIFMMTQLGWEPLVSALALVGFGIIWFFVYGVKRVSFRGTFQKALSENRELRAKQVESAKVDGSPIKILIPVSKLKHEGDIMMLSSWIAKERSALVQVVQVKEIPVQTPYEVILESIKGAETEFGLRTQEHAKKIGIRAETYEIVSHDWKTSVVNFARSQGTDLILLDWEEEFHHELIRGSDVHWIMDHAPCDVTVFKDRGVAELSDILLTTTAKVYDNLKVRMANSIALAKNARVTFFQVIDPQSSPMQKRNVRKYHEILTKNCTCKSSSIIVEGRDVEDEILKEAKKHNLLIMGSTTHHRLLDAIWGHIEDRVVKKVECSVLITKYVGSGAGTNIVDAPFEAQSDMPQAKQI